jgi:arsenate reductase
MTRRIAAVTLALFAFLASVCTTAAAEKSFLEPLRPYLVKVVGGVDKIPAERRAMLKATADFISKQLAEGKEAKLTFICTHNSRRSHLGQVWAQVAACYYGIPNLTAFSGGVEATACNIRTVQALRRAGVAIVRSTEGTNPIYLAQYAEDAVPMRLFSKIYNVAGNPTEGFAAMMCCADADTKCPATFGQLIRIPLHYDDPKAADNTVEEAAKYDERSLQIATEMFYVMSWVKVPTR